MKSNENDEKDIKITINKEYGLMVSRIHKERPFSVSYDIFKYPLFLCDKCQTCLFIYKDTSICYECARNNNLICYECRAFMNPSKVQTHVCDRNEMLQCRRCCKNMMWSNKEERKMMFEYRPERIKCSGKTFTLYCEDCVDIAAAEDWTTPRKPKEGQISIPPKVYKKAYEEIKGSIRPYYLGAELYSYRLDLCFNCAGDLLRKFDTRICYDCAKFNDLICRKCDVFMLPSTLIEHEYDDGKCYNLYCKECCKTMDWTIKPHNDIRWKEEAEEKIDYHSQFPFSYLKELPKSFGSKKFDFVENGRWVKVIYRIDKALQSATTYSMFIKDVKVTRKAELEELSATTHPGAKINAIYSKWYKELSPEQVQIYRNQAEEDNDKRGVRQTTKAARWRSVLRRFTPDDLIPIKKDPIDKPTQSTLLESVPLIHQELSAAEEEEDDLELIMLDGAPDNVIFRDNDVIEIYSTGAREVIYVTDDDEDSEEVVISLKRPAPLEHSEIEPKRLKSRYCEIVY